MPLGGDSELMREVYEGSQPFEKLGHNWVSESGWNERNYPGRKELDNYLMKGRLTNRGAPNLLPPLRGASMPIKADSPRWQDNGYRTPLGGDPKLMGEELE